MAAANAAAHGSLVWFTVMTVLLAINMAIYIDLRRIS